MQQKVTKFLQVGLAGAVGFTGISLYKADEKFYSQFLMPTLQRVWDGEQAHEWAVWAAEKKLLIPAPDLRHNAIKGVHPITNKTLVILF